MGETKISFSKTQQRLLFELTRRQASEMNEVLELIYAELGIKEQMVAKQGTVSYRLLPDLSGIIEEDKSKKDA